VFGGDSVGAMALCRLMRIVMIKGICIVKVRRKVLAMLGIVRISSGL